MSMRENGTVSANPARREVLAYALGGGAASVFPRSVFAQNRTTLVDSHVHLVTNDTGRYPPRPLRGSLLPGVLDNPVTPERVLAWMDETGVSHAVVVQRTQVYGYDNSYVLDAAERHPARFTAIACVDAQNKSAPRQVEQWISERGAAGIRLTASGGEAQDIAWLASNAARETWAAVNEAGGTMCLLIRASQRASALRAVAELAAGFPKLPIVVDHLADANIAGADAGIDQTFQALVPHANVHFKFSTITFQQLAEAKIAPGPLLARWVSAFGANRLIWGSDIGNSNASYAEMTAKAREAFAGNEPAGAAALTGTARAIYGRYYK